jgi:glioma pathogenesis-related protein 2
MIGIVKLVFLIVFLNSTKCFARVIDSDGNFFQKCLEEFRKVSLDKHNEFRRKHNSSILLHDSEVELTAQNYANELARTNDFVHSKNENVGENLFAKHSTEKFAHEMCKSLAEECVTSWYNEVSLFNFENPDFEEKTGHFTQLVWNGSKKLGTGFAIGQVDEFAAYYCVAHYFPPGNVIGRFRKNVNRISEATNKIESEVNRREDNNFSQKCLDEFRKVTLDYHNELRKKHNSSILLHDNEIEMTAQNHANSLAKTNDFVHSENRGNVGENLFAKYSTEELSLDVCKSLARECVDSWYNEISMYDFERPGFDLKTGHFTQVVWNGSKKLGTGFAMGEIDEYTSFYCVSHYLPNGNVLGRFRKNVNRIKSSTTEASETSTSTTPLPKEEIDDEVDEEYEETEASTSITQLPKKEMDDEIEEEYGETEIINNVVTEVEVTKVSNDSTLPRKEIDIVTVIENEVTTTITETIEPRNEIKVITQPDTKVPLGVESNLKEIVDISECLIKLNRYFFQNFATSLLAAANVSSQTIDMKRYNEIIEFFSQSQKKKILNFK